MRNDDPARRYGRRQGNFGEDDSENYGRQDWSDRGRGEQYEQSPPFEDPHTRQGPFRGGNDRSRDQYQGGGNYERMQYGQGARQHSGQRYGGENWSDDDHYGEVERYGVERGYQGPHGRYDRYSQGRESYGRGGGGAESWNARRSGQGSAERYSGSARSMPKGYTRSDERIKEDVCDRLSHSGLDVSDVSVEVSNGQVTLEGTVKDRYAKHAIEDCADDCMGVQDIDNRIRVQRESGATSAGQGATGSGATGSSSQSASSGKSKGRVSG